MAKQQWSLGLDLEYTEDRDPIGTILRVIERFKRLRLRAEDIKLPR